MKRVFQFLAGVLSLMFSFSSFGAEIQPPVITVSHLFGYLITFSDFQDWTMYLDSSIEGSRSEINHGSEGNLGLQAFSQPDFQARVDIPTHNYSLVTWPQTPLRKAKLLELEQKMVFVLTHPLHQKPIRISEETSSFFEGLSSDIPRDGTFMAFKYVFIPESVISPKDIQTQVNQDPEDPNQVKERLGPPLFFYLTKKISGDLGEDEFQTKPNDDEIKMFIKNATQSYYCYHSACVHKEPQNQSLPLYRAMLQVSADLGNSQAQWEFAVGYAQGGREGPDYFEARRYAKLAADQGCVLAQAFYGTLLRGSEGGEPCPIQARHYLKLAADQGNAPAQNTYSAMLQIGEGGDQDLSQALHYLKLAADQGYDLAQQRLPAIQRQLRQSQRKRSLEPSGSSDHRPNKRGHFKRNPR